MLMWLRDTIVRHLALKLEDDLRAMITRWMRVLGVTWLKYYDGTVIMRNNGDTIWPPCFT